ncbi:MAG: hypothetical protein ACM3ZB_10705 [bacterium]
MAEPHGERRLEPRLLCADLMQVEWIGESGEAVSACGNLEDISTAGACVQVERAVPVDSEVCLRSKKAEFHGRVRYCVFRDTGYFVGIQFKPDSRWNRAEFRPKHLLDPRRLSRLSLRRALRANPTE